MIFMKTILSILFALFLTISPAFALSNTLCISNNILERNTSISVNGNWTNTTEQTYCPYGCYTDRCNTPPVKDTVSMVYVAIFAMLIGFVSLFIALKRDGLMWSVLATVVFLSNVLYSSGIPFEVNAVGQLVGTSANFILIGISLIFTFISLFLSFKFGFELLDLL